MQRTADRSGRCGRIVAGMASRGLDRPTPSSDAVTAAEPMSAFRSSDLLCNRFRVVRFIARGGMGELYEAEDSTLGERVALKTIRPEIAKDARATQRFRREVQLARKVTHAEHLPHLRPVRARAPLPATPARRAARLRHHGAAARRDDVAAPQPEGHRSRPPRRCRSSADGRRTRRRARRRHRPPRLQEQQRDAARRPAAASPCASSSPISASRIASTSTATRRAPPSPRPATSSGTPDYMAPEQVEGKPRDAGHRHLRASASSSTRW